MTKLNHPDHTGKAIEVAPDQVANYETQGWTEVQSKPKSD